MNIKFRLFIFLGLMSKCCYGLASTLPIVIPFDEPQTVDIQYSSCKSPIFQDSFLVTDQSGNGSIKAFTSLTEDKPYWTFNFPEGDSGFKNPTEAKISPDRRSIYFASSEGRIGVIDVCSRKINGSALPGGNPHSIEVLPDGSIISASSMGGIEKKGEPTDQGFITYWTTSFSEESGMVWRKHWDSVVPSAHGAVFDQNRDMLWVIGKNALYGYEYSETQEFQGQSLALLNSKKNDFVNGMEGGHDLIMMADGNQLMLSVADGIYMFDIESEKFSLLREIKSVKSISENRYGVLIARPKVGETVEKSWRTKTVEYEKGNDISTFYLDGESEIYKARFVR